MILVVEIRFRIFVHINLREYDSDWRLKILSTMDRLLINIRVFAYCVDLLLDVVIVKILFLF